MKDTQSGKRNGNVRADEYTKEDYMQRLDRLIQRLQEESSVFKFDRKNLAQLLAGLKQFMEDALGINAVYKPMPKLPAKLLRNFAPDGPLYTIATECGKHMNAKKIKRMDWQNPSTRKENMDLLARIRQELVRGGHLYNPRVYIHPSLGTNQLKLRDTVKKMGGETVQAADVAGVTHVLFPFGSKGDPDDGQHYMSTIEVSGPRALVHWWYLPDSYDEWIPAETAPADLDVERKPKGPWKVYVRWLIDSEKYNEWMNEADYETEEAAAEAETSGAKRKKDDTQEDLEHEKQQTKQARMGTCANPLPEIEVGAGQTIRPGVVKQQVLMPHQKALAPATAVDISQGQRPEGSWVPQVAQPKPTLGTCETRTASQDTADALQKSKMLQQVLTEEIKPGIAFAMDSDAAEEQEKSVQQSEDASDIQRPLRQVYRIPASSSWFNWNTISSVEREVCSDFFSGKSASRTAVLYREYRNAIINKYREDPARDLDFTTVRKLLVGDVSAIREVYDRCLDWGLINYTSRQQQGVPVLELVVDGRVPGGMRMSLGPSNDALLRLPRHVRPSEAVEAAATGGGGSAKVVARRNVFRQPTHKQPVVANGVRYFCNAMPWVECTQLRYHCTKVPDVDLCPEAFAEGRFPPGCTAKDFVRLDALQSPPDPSGWADQETLLLLEGLELYGENWAEIADHVGTKSQMQCILHFLQMPIEEQFLEDLGNTKGKAGMEEPLPPPKASAMQHSEEEHEEAKDDRTFAVPEDLVPFADVGNPVMAQVAFLATMVGPRVAAAAAQRALEVLAEEDREAGASLNELHGGSKGDIGAQAAIAEEAIGERITPISSARLRTAAATALSAAAVKARVLADAEERECQRLVTAAIEAQFQKVQFKLQYLEQLDEVMVAERAQLEALRSQHNKDRMLLLESSNQAQQVQQAAALQVAQLQHQAAMIQHSAAAQVQAAQHAASTLIQQQQQQQPSSSAGGAASAHKGASS